MKMIKYCYCKTRPLKIPSVCGWDAPEQEVGLVEPLFFFCRSCFYVNVTFRSIQSIEIFSPRSGAIFSKCPIFIGRISVRNVVPVSFITNTGVRCQVNAAPGEEKLRNINPSPLRQTLGPAGCHFPATHLNCFTYMYIFIQLMPVQCMILPTRKINTHIFFSFFFSSNDFTLKKFQKIQ